MNWRPFEGLNPNASIIHFHGPKPHRIAEILSGKAYAGEVPSQKLLMQNTESYKIYLSKFNSYLAKDQ
jgi:hypothetical protein